MLQTIYDPGMAFTVPKEKLIPLVTVFRTTEHVIKQQFRWLCYQGTAVSDRGQVALELVRNLASANIGRTAGPQRTECTENPDT